MKVVNRALLDTLGKTPRPGDRPDAFGNLEGRERRRHRGAGSDDDAHRPRRSPTRSVRGSRRTARCAGSPSRTCRCAITAPCPAWCARCRKSRRGKRAGAGDPGDFQSRAAPARQRPARRPRPGAHRSVAAAEGTRSAAVARSRRSTRRRSPRSRDLLAHAIQSTRSLARGLAPVNLERGGLPEALKHLAARCTDMYSLQCTFAQRRAEAAGPGRRRGDASVSNRAGSDDQRRALRACEVDRDRPALDGTQAAAVDRRRRHRPVRRPGATPPGHGPEDHGIPRAHARRHDQLRRARTRARASCCRRRCTCCGNRRTKLTPRAVVVEAIAARSLARRRHFRTTGTSV